MAVINRLSFLFFALAISLSSSQYADLGPLEKVTREFFRTGNVTEELLTTLHAYPFTHLLRDNRPIVYDAPTVCYYCNLVVDLVIGERFLGLSRESLVEEAIVLCTHLDIEPERVCAGIIDLNVDVLLYVIDNYQNFTSNRVCGSVLQSFGCPTGDAFEWSVDIASGSSPEKPKPNDTAVPNLTILQLSDIHYDPDYTPNGNAACGEPICCQSDQGEPATPEEACGYWSDYRDGDSSWQLVEETVRQAKTQEVDYVYYTGDIISHRVWDTSVEKNTESFTRINTYLNDNFDVPVFPVFGNHEPHPLNLWPQPGYEGFGVDWLFQLAAEQWSDMIGQDVSETVLKGGYYSVSPQPGFRVIGINSNLGYTDNFWLIYDDLDPFNQLQWLADTLEEAESNNESVHILGHVPSGQGDALKVWSREYHKIIERFANTVTAQFNGHTHKDEFHVYFNSSDVTQAISVAFNGASVTPFSYNNPSFKYYYVDEDTFNVLDYDEWTFNLTLANELGASETPDWYKLYSFLEAYGGNTCIPSEVNQVLYRMAQDHSLLESYGEFYHRNSDPGNAGGCDEGCQRGHLCDIATTLNGNNEPCDHFLALYDQQ